MNENYRIRLNKGMCGRCGIRMRYKGLYYCSVCRKKKLKGQRSSYKKQKSKGLCTHGICKNKPEKGRLSCRKHLMEKNENSKIFRYKLKSIVFSKYGNKCACCGEVEKSFLQIDHVNNDGAKHRETLGDNVVADFYRWIIKNSFPKNLQILCANCNFSKRLNDICVHKFKKRKHNGL